MIRVCWARSINLSLKKQKLAVSILTLVSCLLLLFEKFKVEQAWLEKSNRCKELYHLLKNSDFLSSPEQKVPVSGNTNFRMNYKLMNYLLLTQECPWEANATAVAQYRAELGQCCNASFLLVLTRKNTPLGSKIHLDGTKNGVLSLNRRMINQLSERFPVANSPYGKCALVGNGGILRGSGCGREIDQADLIIRFNLPPLNSTEDVGTKSNLVTINPSILTFKFHCLEEQRKPFVDALRPYRDALFLVASLSYESQIYLGFRALYTMEDFGLTRRAFFLNPQYLGSLHDYWSKKGLKEQRLSSGFMFISVALELCRHITLYGFWPFPFDLNGKPIFHHYFDNKLPKPGAHSMTSEFSYYFNMYKQGVLRMRLGQCH